MDYREVLEEQIRTLQMLQAEIVNDNSVFIIEKIGSAAMITERIETLVSRINELPVYRISKK